MSTIPRLSLVVCTRNRAAQLGLCLEAVGKLDCHVAWELIVVDNGSDDHTGTVIKAFQDRKRCNMKIVHAPIVGLSRARNLGLAAARGDIIAFIDDDCYPVPGYLNAILETFDDPLVGFAGGRVLLHDPSDQRITLQESTTALRIAPGIFLRSGMLHGANMAFRRDALLSVRGFDERLGAGSPFKAAEDSDAQRRVSADGWYGRYAPELVVRHHHGRRGPAEVRALLRGYDCGIGAGMAKCLADPRLRRAYLRGWWWKLREVGWRRGIMQIVAALTFVLRHGPSARRLLTHPATPFAPRFAGRVTN